jgi:nicotinamidase-related amidase
MLTIGNTALIIIDMQEKLARVMYQLEKLVDNLQKLIKGIQILNIPIIVTEQYPKGLGATLPEIAQLIPDIQPISKLSFSCLDDDKFVSKFKKLERKQILVSGIESHVCVYQTVRDLANLGYEVYLVTDTVSSRTLGNREIGLNMMNRLGAVLTSTETVLFELLRVAEGDRFKKISQIIK